MGKIHKIHFWCKIPSPVVLHIKMFIRIRAQNNNNLNLYARFQQLIA